jgi:hypothetical protein
MLNNFYHRLKGVVIEVGYTCDSKAPRFLKEVLNETLTVQDEKRSDP